MELDLSGGLETPGTLLSRVKKKTTKGRLNITGVIPVSRFTI